MVLAKFDEFNAAAIAKLLLLTQQIPKLKTESLNAEDLLKKIFLLQNTYTKL
jgi:hypothetical protein